MSWIIATGTALAILAAPASAQQTRLGAEVRPRYELRNPAGSGGVDEFTSMRVRLGLAAVLDESLTIFAQIQDVRLWGEESSPLLDYRADNLDLHQGYFRYRNDWLDGVGVTVGRMEVTFGGERLVGTVNWTQQGQSFDGVRLDVRHGVVDAALVAYRIADESAPTASADIELYGAYGTLSEVVPGSLDMYWLYDRTEGAVASGQHTLGARWLFQAPGGLAGRLEGTFQTGSRGAADVSAFLVGARLGRAFSADRFGVTLWYDYVSGDDPSTPRSEVFHTLYATNHRFYGLADVFLDIPSHTGGSGLQDVAVKLSWRPMDDLSLGAEAHAFRAAERRSLTGARFGEEVDLTATHAISEYLTASAGFSYVFQAPPLGEIGRLSEDLSWLYLMLSAAF